MKQPLSFTGKETDGDYLSTHRTSSGMQNIDEHMNPYVKAAIVIVPAIVKAIKILKNR